MFGFLWVLFDSFFLSLSSPPLSMIFDFEIFHIEFHCSPSHRLFFFFYSRLYIVSALFLPFSLKYISTSTPFPPIPPFSLHIRFIFHFACLNVKTTLYCDFEKLFELNTILYCTEWNESEPEEDSRKKILNNFK
jgi:hypothetical protein